MVQQRLDQEHLNRTALQLEAQQRVLDQQQEFLDKQQRLLAAVTHPEMTSLLQQNQMMQQMHQQQAALTQQQLEVPPLSGQVASQDRSETSEQVGTSEDAPQPPQVFGSGTIKQIVYDSLCAASKNDNPVMFVNSQGGQITILNNTSKGSLTGVPGTVVTIDGKRHFFPSDSVPSKPAAASDLGDSSVNRAAEVARAQQEDEGLSHHSRDASQNGGAQQQAEGDPLLSALSCSVSDQGRNRPDTSHSQHQGEHEPGNSMAEATSRANGEGALHAEGPRGTSTYAATVARHRSPSPMPIGQRLPPSPLLAGSQGSLGDALEQARQAPALSDPNSEGTNSWQGYANTGKLFQAAQGGAPLLNAAQFQGSFQDPSSSSGGPTLTRHPSQSLLQSIPSRPSTPVAILSADGTITVTVNGLMSQAIPVVTLGAQTAHLLGPAQSSNPATLSQMLQYQQQQQQQPQMQRVVQQPQVVQSGQMQNQQPQVFQNQNLQPTSAGLQYVQLVQGGSYQVQQPNMQGMTAVGQALPAVASLSGQQSLSGGNIGAAVQNQMGQGAGGPEVLYVQAPVGQTQQQQPSIQQSTQLDPQVSLAFANSMTPAFQTQQAVPTLLQPTPVLQAASSLPTYYQQVQANSGPQGMPLSGQLSSVIQPQQMLQVPSSQMQPAVTYQYSQEMQQLLSNQHQPQSVQAAWPHGPAPNINPLTSGTLVQKLEQLHDLRCQVPQSTIYQDPNVGLAAHRADLMAQKYPAQAESLRDASQTAVTTAYSQSESEEVHSRSRASTQLLSQGARESERGSQGTVVLGQMQQSQHPGRSNLGSVPPSQNNVPPSESDQAAHRPSAAQALPAGAFAFVPPTPPFHGTPNTVLPALPRNLQPQANPSMLRTVSSSVSAAGSLHEGLSRASSGQASVNRVPDLQRTAGVARTGSGLRVNYVHDEADALAAAAHVASNNGMKLPDFGLEQTRGDVLVEKLFSERREEPQETQSEGLPHSSRDGHASVEPLAITALKSAAKLAEASHVAANQGGGTNMEGQVSKLHRAKSFPGSEAIHHHGGGQHAAFLNVFSNSEVTVSPPLLPPSKPPPEMQPGPPLRSEPELPPPREKSSFRETVDISVSAVPLQGPLQIPAQTGPPSEDAFFSPSGAAAQALSFLNDEPDPNFQPQAVKCDPTTAEKLYEGTSESVQPSPSSTLDPASYAERESERKRKAAETIVAGSSEPAPVVASGHHSREISLVDGFFLDAIVDEQEGKKARKLETGASPNGNGLDHQLEARPHAWHAGFQPN